MLKQLFSDVFSVATAGCAGRDQQIAGRLGPRKRCTEEAPHGASVRGQTEMQQADGLMASENMSQSLEALQSEVKRNLKVKVAA